MNKRRREELAFLEADDHRKSTKHSVMRAGGSWECLNCVAGNTQKSLKLQAEQKAEGDPFYPVEDNW